MVTTLRVGVVGLGYWGPNLLRNFMTHPDTTVHTACDADADRLEFVRSTYPGAHVTTDFAHVLDDDSVDAVAIATPPETHQDLATRALEAGKHVLIEKPLAASLAAGQEIVAAAARADRVLMCDHTYCHTSSVRAIRDLVVSGDIGDILYLDSVRINLGLIQREVDVIWDLAPHDLSIFNFVLPADARPVAVSAQAGDPLGLGHASVAYLTLRLANGGLAHAHLNWLSPTKIRKTIVAGSKRMIVWDDLLPSQRVSVFDSGIDLDPATAAPEVRAQRHVAYRIGDMTAPAIPEVEALTNVVDEFVHAIRTGTPPTTDGHAGLEVLQQLEAATASIAAGGSEIALEPLGPSHPPLRPEAAAGG